MLFILTSCSSNENEEILVTPKLPISYEHIDSSGKPDIINYIYDANNFLKGAIAPDDDFKIEFIYNNEKIIAINQLSDAGVILTKEEYEYKGNNISRYTRNENNTLVIDDRYTYDTNNILISVEEKTSGIIKDYEYNSSDNSLKIFERDNPSNYSITVYDTKNYIFSGIENLHTIFISQGNKGLNNPLERKEYSNGNLNFSEVYTNEYDNDNFLIKTTRNQYYGAFTETYIDKWNYNK